MDGDKCFRLVKRYNEVSTQLEFTFSKSTIGILEKVVEPVQSLQ